MLPSIPNLVIIVVIVEAIVGVHVRVAVDVSVIVVVQRLNDVVHDFFNFLSVSLEWVGNGWGR